MEQPRTQVVGSGFAMKLAVVTPTWNRSRSLGEMVRSVEGQVFQPFKHVVVDNLSGDQTPEVVREYQKRAAYEVVHLREGDSGIYDAMNKGAAAAGDCEAFYFLNDDDSLAKPASLQLLVAALGSSPGGVAFADVWVEAPDGARRPRNHRQMNRLTLAEKSICQQATAYSRAAFEKVGPFDASLKAAGDYDWMLRALAVHRLRAVYLRHPVAVFRTGGISSNAAWRGGFEAEMRAVAARHLDAATIARAKSYRRFWRKIPWGRALMPGSDRADSLGVRTRSVFAGRLCPDPLSWMDF